MTSSTRSASCYLDNNATTVMDPEVAELMHDLYLSGLTNPASQHRAGRAALTVLEDAKSDLLQLVGAPCSGMHSANVVLTSGGTEANNLAILGLANSVANEPPGDLVVSSIEHPSVLEPAQYRTSSGSRSPGLRILPVDHEGIVRLDLLERWLAEANQPSAGNGSSLAKPISLVSVMLGNNEVGVIQPLEQVCQLCHQYGALVHCDAVQAIGKIPFNMSSCGVDALTITAHKLHGPPGIGALILRPGLQPQPLLHGGGQQLELRPGTEPVVLAAGFAKCVSLAIEAQSRGDYQRLAALRDRFEAELAKLSSVQLVAKKSPRLPHTSNIAFCGLDRQAVQMALDMRGVACSTGSACASGSGRPSHVLQAMQQPDEVVASSIRFSFSRYTSDDEITGSIEAIQAVVQRLRAKG